MAELDLSLRKSVFDPFNLLPAFLRELDASAGNDGYRILSSAWQNQWFQLYDLINGIISPAHDLI